MDEPGCLNIVSRPLDRVKDEAFIYATWRNSLFYGSQDLKKADNPKEIFKQLTRDIRETLKGAIVRVACLEESPEVIVGYVVYTQNHLNWVYVKEEFRKQGVASLMVPKDIETVTPRLTKIGKAILEKKQKENEDGSKEERP